MHASPLILELENLSRMELQNEEIFIERNILTKTKNIIVLCIDVGGFDHSNKRIYYN